MTLGATNTLNNIKSWVFGDHISENAAAYSQFEIKAKKWDFTTGLRLEFCKLDTLPFLGQYASGWFTLRLTSIRNKSYLFIIVIYVFKIQ